MTDSPVAEIEAAPGFKLALVQSVTVARLLLTPVIAWAIVTDRPLLAGWLCGAAGITDVLDGYLARTLRATSATGQYLDPIADKILLSGVYLALAWHGSVPWSLVALILGRDAALVAASAIAMRFTSYDNYRPTIFGKISTFFQIITAVVILASNAFPNAGIVTLSRVSIWLTALATVGSAAHYAWRGIAFFRRR
ncbi:MAG: CDP-alcohol phosphatidyltransferase family protein [Acidobacteriota bacterium]|nr:CDP-alcohol phosphatidyltransferase family protein [Acidobacteriota bacterium]